MGGGNGAPGAHYGPTDCSIHDHGHIAGNARPAAEPVFASPGATLDAGLLEDVDQRAQRLVPLPLRPALPSLAIVTETLMPTRHFRFFLFYDSFHPGLCLPVALNGQRMTSV